MPSTVEDPWDGEGVDPWLPRQLADELDADVAESSFRLMLADGLARWLKAVSGAVLGQAIPDVHALYTKDQMWRGVVGGLVDGPLKTSMVNMYTDLLGEGDWEKRSMVTQQLAEATNRMMRFPDTVFDLLSDEKTRITQSGGSVQDVVAGLSVFLGSGEKRWDARANLITRTEVLSALNAGRFDAMKIIDGSSPNQLYHMWLSMHDQYVRSSHLTAHGQVVPIGQTFEVGLDHLRFPCDPLGSIEETINCRCRAVQVDENGRSVQKG
jgi:hypothetical protein